MKEIGLCKGKIYPGNGWKKKKDGQSNSLTLGSNKRFRSSLFVSLATTWNLSSVRSYTPGVQKPESLSL